MNNNNNILYQTPNICSIAVLRIASNELWKSGFTVNENKLYENARGGALRRLDSPTAISTADAMYIFFIRVIGY